MKRLLAAVWGWVAFWHRPVFDFETWPIVPSPPCLAEGEELSNVALHGFKPARINEDEEHAADAMRERGRNAAYSPNTTDLRVQIEGLQAKFAKAHFAELADSVIQEIRALLFKALTNSRYAWPEETPTEHLIAALQDDRDTWHNRANVALKVGDDAVKHAEKQAIAVREALLLAIDDVDASECSDIELIADLSNQIRTLRENAKARASRKRPRKT